MGWFRGFFMLIDKVVFGLIDFCYNLIFSLSSLSITNDKEISDIVEALIHNAYAVVGVFAFFRIAVLLINALIDPEKLNEKGKGLSNIFVRTVIMIVLLVFMPTLFNMAYDLQGEIIGTVDSNNNKKSNHIIEKIILGDSYVNSSTDVSPGDQFKTIAVSSMITVNHKFAKPLNPDGTDCSGKNCVYLINPETNNGEGGYISDCGTQACVDAIDAYNEMYVNGKMDLDVLKDYIAVSEIKDDKKEFVYDYSILLTTFVGGFIVYILLGFALDIAARYFQLIALEVLSPLFVASFVDPKSTSSGMFSKWLKEVGTTYVGLFIRIASVSLLLLFVSIISKMDIGSIVLGDNGVWIKITLLLGALIFAKKLPKWFSDMLGIQTEGVGGLAKKITEGALGGALIAKGAGLAKKGAKGLTGAGLAGAKNLGALRRNTSDMKKKNPNLARTKAGAALAGFKGGEGGFTKRWNAAKKAHDEYKKDVAGRKEANLGMKRAAKRGANALLNGALAFSGAAKADKLSGSLKVAKDASSNFKKAKGLKGDTWFTKQKDKFEKKKSSFNEDLYGNVQARLTRADEEKERRNHERSFKDTSQLPDGFEIAKQTHYDAYTRVKGEDGVWHYGASHDERLAMIGIAMAGGKNIKLDEANRIVSYEDASGATKYVGKDFETKQFTNSAVSQMPEYGLAQFQKYSADLESRLVGEYGSRTGDLNDLQARLTNVANSIATATSRAMNGVFDKLKGGFNIPVDVNANNLNAKISEINADISRLSSVSNPSSEVTAQLEAQRAQLAELQGLSNAMTQASSVSEGITYQGGQIIVNGDTNNPMSPETFRNYVNGLSDENQKTVLSQTMEYHISAAQAQLEMVQTQRHIEALTPTCDTVGTMVDPVRGVEDPNKVIDGTLSQKVEIKVKKANEKYETAFQAEKDKGNIKDDE